MTKLLDKLGQLPHRWVWREMIAEAIENAQARLDCTQAELAKKVGIVREGLVMSRSWAVPRGETLPRRACGLQAAVKVARLAGWSEERVLELAVHHTEERLFRYAPDHYETLMLMPEPNRTKRWQQLAKSMMERATDD